MALQQWDFVVIAVYFGCVVAIGIYSMFRANRGTISGYFLAGRHMKWFSVGASLFASNIGSEHFIGLAGSGAAAGIAVGAFELNAGIILQMLGWIYLPVYIASRVSTLPEYMSKRFGGQRIRVFLSVLSLLLYIFTKISVNLYSGALFIRLVLNWDLYFSILVLLALTAVCTITGGLAAVIYLDSLQTLIMICGGIILSVKGFLEVGGFMELMVRYNTAVANKTLANNTCGHPREDAWVMMRDPINSDLPWPGFWFGQTAASLWYWCSDQMMVQRALASKSLSHAQGGTIFTGYIKFLPLFLIVMPGMISRVLYPDIVACAVPEECEKYCGSRISCSNLAYPLLIIKLLPEGLKGILMAVMLAALMSDLTSVFNSASTLFTMDIWHRIRKSATTKELLIVGKLFVVVMLGLSIAWVPIILAMQGGQLFYYIQSISAYLSPPIAAIYILAVFWKRCNELGAFSALISGFAIGLIRMGLDFYYREPACGEEDTRPLIIANVHFMYFAMILFWITILVAAGVSVCTKPPQEYLLIRTLYWTRFDDRNRPDELFSTKTQNPSSDNGPDIIGIPLEVKIANGSQQSIKESRLANSTAVLTKPVNSEKVPKLKRFCFWFFGYSPDKTQIENTETMQAHLLKISSLEQNPKWKIFLLINVFIIILITIGFNVFFTIGTPWLLKNFEKSRGG